MKKILIITVAVCALMIYLAGTAYLEAKKSGGDSAFLDAVNTDALEWGFKFGSAIPVKPHIVDRSKSQYRIIKTYLELEKPEDAAECASRMGDWHECLAYADLAIHFARKGRFENVQHYQKRSDECRNKLTGWQNSWQRDRILLRIAEAQVIAGQLAAAEEIESELPAETASLARTLRLSRMDGPGDYKKSVRKLQSMENSQHMEVLRDVARAYVEILRQMGPEATVEQYSSLQGRVYGLAERLPQLLQHEILCSLSRTVFDAGRNEIGCQVLEDAEKRLKSRRLQTRFDVGTLAELAGIWDEYARESQRAESLLNEAESLFMKSGLKGKDRVRALMALGEGYRIHGSRDRAWDFFGKALQTAGAQTNARPRAMAITEICAAIGRWGEPMPDHMAKEMTHHYEALGDPW